MDPNNNVIKRLCGISYELRHEKRCLRDKCSKDPDQPAEKYTLQPLYNTVHYNTVMDITPFKDGSQNV